MILLSSDVYIEFIIYNTKCEQTFRDYYLTDNYILKHKTYIHYNKEFKKKFLQL